MGGTQNINLRGGGGIFLKMMGGGVVKIPKNVFHESPKKGPKYP